MARLTASGDGGHAAYMHALPAQVHYLVNLVLTVPTWRAIPIALVAGLLLRVTMPGRTTRGASLTVVLASVALVLPSNPLWPATPLARLPGALLLLVIANLIAPRPPGKMSWFRVFVTACLTAWWLRGAPLAGSGIATVIPVFLGLLTASAVAGRLATRDTGSATVAAAIALATAVWMTQGPILWVYAALLPAATGIAFLGRTEAAAPLAQATMLVAVATIVAFDHGRLTPVDLATIAPLAVWGAAPRILRCLNRAGPALAASLAAVGGIALVWATTRLLWPH